MQIVQIARTVLHYVSERPASVRPDKAHFVYPERHFEDRIFRDGLVTGQRFLLLLTFV